VTVARLIEIVLAVGLCLGAVLALVCTILTIVSLTKDGRHFNDAEDYLRAAVVVFFASLLSFGLGLMWPLVLMIAIIAGIIALGVWIRSKR
jgi:hypothetical protein